MKNAQPVHTIPKPESFGWGSVVLWSVVTTIGWAAGWAPSLGSIDLMLSIRGGANLFTILPLAIYASMLGLFGGLIIAVGQWLILLSAGRRGSWWLGLTVVGMTTGWFLAGVLTPYAQMLFDVPGAYTELTVGRGLVHISIVESGAATAGIVGLLVGLGQWLVLKRWATTAYWWVLVSAIGWAAGGAGYWMLYGAVGGPFSGPYSYWTPEQWTGWPVYLSAVLAGWIAGGIVVGGLSGLTLKLILDSGDAKLLSSTSVEQP